MKEEKIEEGEEKKSAKKMKTISDEDNQMKRIMQDEDNHARVSKQDGYNHARKDEDEEQHCQTGDGHGRSERST